MAPLSPRYAVVVLAERTTLRTKRTPSSPLAWLWERKSAPITSAAAANRRGLGRAASEQKRANAVRVAPATPDAAIQSASAALVVRQATRRMAQVRSAAVEDFAWSTRRVQHSQAAPPSVRAGMATEGRASTAAKHTTSAAMRTFSSPASLAVPMTSTMAASAGSGSKQATHTVSASPRLTLAHAA